MQCLQVAAECMRLARECEFNGNHEKAQWYRGAAHAYRDVAKSMRPTTLTAEDPPDGKAAKQHTKETPS